MIGNRPTVGSPTEASLVSPELGGSRDVRGKVEPGFEEQLLEAGLLASGGMPAASPTLEQVPVGAMQAGSERLVPERDSPVLSTFQATVQSAAQSALPQAAQSSGAGGVTPTPEPITKGSREEKAALAAEIAAQQTQKGQFLAQTKSGKALGAGEVFDPLSVLKAQNSELAQGVTPAAAKLMPQDVGSALVLPALGGKNPVRTAASVKPQVPESGIVLNPKAPPAFGSPALDPLMGQAQSLSPYAGLLGEDVEVEEVSVTPGAAQAFARLNQQSMAKAKAGSQPQLVSGAEFLGMRERSPAKDGKSEDSKNGDSSQQANLAAAMMPGASSAVQNAGRGEPNSRGPTVELQTTSGSGAKPRLTTDAVQTLGNNLGQLAQQGGGEMRIRIRPEHMGELRIHVTTQGDKVGLKIKATDENAKKILEDSIDALKESMAGAKLQLAGVEVAVVNPTSQNAQSDLNSSQYQNDQARQMNLGAETDQRQSQNEGSRSSLRDMGGEENLNLRRSVAGGAGLASGSPRNWASRSGNGRLDLMA